MRIDLALDVYLQGTPDYEKLVWYHVLIKDHLECPVFNEKAFFSSCEYEEKRNEAYINHGSLDQTISIPTYWERYHKRIQGRSINESLTNKKRSFHGKT